MTMGRIIISSSNLGSFAPSSPSEPASHVQYSAFVSEFVQVVKVLLQEVQVSGGVKSLLHLFLTAKACTEIRVTTEDNSTVVIGRSMEWSSDLRSDIIVEPRGIFTRSIYPFTALILIMLVHHFKTGQIDIPSSTSVLSVGMILPVME